VEDGERPVKKVERTSLQTGRFSKAGITWRTHNGGYERLGNKRNEGGERVEQDQPWQLVRDERGATNDSARRF
jgi:hypothetical protein